MLEIPPGRYLDDLAGPWPTLLITGLVTSIIIYWKYQGPSFAHFPVINSYTGDVTGTKAKEKFIVDAQGLIREGLTKYPDQPFIISTTLSDRVFLPSSWFDWIRRHPDLDHQAAVAKDFFGDYPGFEAIGAFNDPNYFVINLVKKQMSQISQTMLDTIDSHAFGIIQDNFGDAKTFHDISWGTLCFKMTASVTSAVFSGPTLAHDAEWQRLITSHTTSVFNAARALRAWTKYLRPIVHWFLPDCKAARAQIAEARKKLAEHRLDERDKKSVLAMTHDNKSPDAAVVQLALAAGGIHTSSQLLQQVVLDLALNSGKQPKVIADLRHEIQSVLEESDGRLVPASVAKLTFLDACIKESQRLKPQTLNNLERLALKDVILPNGQMIKKGTFIAVPSEPMWSESNWGSDARSWNPYRYIDSDVKMGLVSSTEKHYAFGAGRFICPGRFLVAAEIKVVLVRMLMGWDLRIQPGQVEKGQLGMNGRVEWKAYGFEQLADGDVVVEVKRRGG